MTILKSTTLLKPMTILTSLGRKIIIPVIALAFVISACDSSNAVDSLENTDEAESFDVAQSISFIATDLNLSTEEISLVQDAFDEHTDRTHEPGFLWNVAARLQANLTDEQKERLFERIENRPFPVGYFAGGQSGPLGFLRRDGGFPGRMGAFGGLFELTAEQKEGMRTLREEFGASLRAIVVSVKDGTTDRSDARPQIEALADDLRSSIDSILTDEQKAARDEKKAEFEARRDAAAEAAREVMISVLGLGAEQVTALERLRASIDEDRLEFRELIEAGATIEDIRELAEAARAAHNEALAGILEPTQYEIFIIHGALASRMKTKRGHFGFDRPMGGLQEGHHRHMG